MQTVTIELDIPMQILTTEDEAVIKKDITGILLNKRTYTSEQLAEYDLQRYAKDNDVDESRNEILARFGNDIYDLGYKSTEKQADEIKEINCEIAETLDAEGYLAKNIICNVGIEDPKANKVMTEINDDVDNAKADKDEILFEPDMNYITCDILQMKIHPEELKKLKENQKFELTSFNDEIQTHKFKLCAPGNKDEIDSNPVFESKQSYLDIIIAFRITSTFSLLLQFFP